MIEPGPRLDALIAEKVFGCSPFIGPSEKYECGCKPMNPSHETMIGSWSRIPEYSTDIKAAWEIISNPPGYGLCEFYLSACRHHKYAWHCSINFGSGEEEYGYSAPHAICLAALKAVGVEVE